MRLLYETVILLFLVVFTESRREYRCGSLPNVYDSGMSKDAEQNCSTGNTTWLNQDKLKQCHLYKLKAIVEESVQMALNHCQNQFRNRRWNCSELSTAKVFQQQGIMKRGIRESAYVYAITSAAVMYRVAEQCILGKWDMCGCKDGRNITRDVFWDWHGCSTFNEFLKYGEVVSRCYMDPSKHDVHSLLIRHNNEAGRMALRNAIELNCKFVVGGFGARHRVCWSILPPFSRVAVLLRGKFEQSFPVRRVNTTLETSYDKRRPSRVELVYTDDSPSFCQAEPSLGTPGTRGRLCKKHSYSTDGCMIMCCARGFTTVTRSTKRKCNCKFTWCCKVKCKICIKKKLVHRCK